MSESAIVRESAKAIGDLASGIGARCEIAIMPCIDRELIHRFFEHSVNAKLTNAELRVLILLAEGLTSKEAATRLERSPKTIDNQVESVLEKLGARNRVQAVAIARRLGLLDTLGTDFQET